MTFKEFKDQKFAPRCVNAVWKLGHYILVIFSTVILGLYVCIHKQLLTNEIAANVLICYRVRQQRTKRGERDIRKKIQKEGIMKRKRGGPTKKERRMEVCVFCL